MDKNLAISVQGVSKIYKLYDKPIDRLKEAVSLTHKSYHRDFFALSDISFDVKSPAIFRRSWSSARALTADTPASRTAI